MTEPQRAIHSQSVRGVSTRIISITAFMPGGINMVRRFEEVGKLRRGRKLVAPELLEVRAAPGGGIAALMVGAAWFGFGEQTDAFLGKNNGCN